MFSSHILLGSQGIELPKISQKLETLSSRKTFEPLDPIAPQDIQSFLKNEKENSILSLIEEVHKNVSFPFLSRVVHSFLHFFTPILQSYESAQNQKWEHIINDWQQEKVKLMNALVAPSQNWIDIRKLPEQTVLNETTYNGRSCLNNQEIAYAKEIYDYNKLVIEGSYRTNLVQKFASIAAGFNDSVRLDSKRHSSIGYLTKIYL